MRDTQQSDGRRSPDLARLPSKPGERRLRAALHRILHAELVRLASRSASEVGEARALTKPRCADPQPYEPDWGWWVERRLAKIESTQKWLVGLAAGALIAQLIHLLLN